MFKLKLFVVVSAIALFGAACAKQSDEAPLLNINTANRSGAEPEQLSSAPPQDEGTQSMTKAVLKTSRGDIALELFSADAPNTVNNFMALAKRDFYDGATFHRVIPDFMIQGGDPLSKDDNPANDGTGGPGYFFDDEINQHKIVRGALAMANAGPDTNGSQFFIVTADATPWLDGKHTVFGRVTEGYEVVDAISAVARDARDRPLENVVIEDVVVE